MGARERGPVSWDAKRAAAVYPDLPDPIRHAIGQAVGAGVDIAHAGELPEVLNVRPDPPDFRDQYYEPGLARLQEEMLPEPMPPGHLRAQGSLGSCTGQALGAVVDILHRRAAGDWRPPASARACSTRWRGRTTRCASTASTARASAAR